MSVTPYLDHGLLIVSISNTVIIMLVLLRQQCCFHEYNFPVTCRRHWLMFSVATCLCWLGLQNPAPVLYHRKNSSSKLLLVMYSIKSTTVTPLGSWSFHFIEFYTWVVLLVSFAYTATCVLWDPSVKKEATKHTAQLLSLMP